MTYVALANSWIIINSGGGPTDDKPTVTLETLPDPGRVNSFLNIRVADIQAHRRDSRRLHHRRPSVEPLGAGVAEGNEVAKRHVAVGVSASDAPQLS